MHRVRLQELAAAAGAASASGDGERAKALWDQARTLVPIESGQYRVLTKRIEHDVAPAASRGLPAGPPERWGLRAGETIAAAALLLARKLRGCWRA